MADTPEERDFFISFSSADLAYAQAIDAALRAEGFSTFFHPNDLPDGGNIIIWMDEALMNSAQTLALFSPDYTKDKAVYSKIERYASLWQDPGSDERKLIPILLRETNFTPLIAPLKRIDVTGMARDEAAAHIVRRLKTPLETKERDRWRVGLPLPKVFNVLYRQNPNFTGRLDELESLQRALRGGNAAITAVAGLGGVGKTTLAAEYCHRFGGRYGGVWWVRAEQESVMLGDLAALGGRLGIAATDNVEADARAALENLTSRTEPWLMVYDNAPNPDAVSNWLPAGSVRCIITSRFSSFDGIATVTSLDQWSDQVTADYLLTRTGRDDNEGALRLAHMLGGLPLAAEQAGVHLRLRAGTSFGDYAADIADLIKRPRPKGSIGDYPDTVYAAFVKSLETLKTIEGSETALNILGLCAFLSPDGVDLALLATEWGERVLPPDFAAAVADRAAREDALAALASLSLLRREDRPGGPVLIFHRLLLGVVRDWIGTDARAVWGNAAVQLVAAAFPVHPDDPSQWRLCEQLMPQILPLDLNAPRHEQAGQSLSYLFNQAAGYLEVRGDRLGALLLGEKALTLARQILPAQSLAIAVRLSNLGGYYHRLGHLDDAEKAYNEALAIEEPQLDATDPSLAITLSNIALLQSERKRFHEAEALYHRAVEIMKARHGTQSAEYAHTISDLGDFYWKWAREPGEQARKITGEKYAAQGLLLTETVRGPRHPETANRHNNFAMMKASEGNWEVAANEAERTLAIMLSLDLGEHPHTRATAASLVSLWTNLGEMEKAQRLRFGDFSSLLPAVEKIETEHREWIAQDPENRRFGPPSPLVKQ